jgi:hypothetical protein
MKVEVVVIHRASPSANDAWRKKFWFGIANVHALITDGHPCSSIGR